MSTFILASNNQKKLKELREILCSRGIEVRSLSDAGILSCPEETGETFEENALIKASAAAQISQLPAIADDSGLCVHSLNLRPGVHSARYAGEGATDAQNVQKLLSEMAEVPKDSRSAYFVCAVALALPSGETHVFRGECQGEILFEPRGTGGFGYDPVFYRPAEGMTFSEMPQTQKNLISHRSAALKKFMDWLKAGNWS